MWDADVQRPDGDCGGQPMIRKYAGMLSNNAAISTCLPVDPARSSVYPHFLKYDEWHEGCRAFPQEGHVYDAYSD
jgi:hypothetical protein